MVIVSPLSKESTVGTLERGGVCIYYQESFAVCAVNITSLTECIVCGVTIQKKGYVAAVTIQKKGYVAVRRSPRQRISRFESFLWWSDDIVTSHEAQIDRLSNNNVWF